MAATVHRSHRENGRKGGRFRYEECALGRRLLVVGAEGGYHLTMGRTNDFVKRAGRGLVCVATAAICLAAVRPASAQAALPDGPGKDQLVKICGQCHEPQRAASIRLTRDGWESTIGDMIARGAKGTDEDFQAILDYLTKNFLGEASRPLNVNTATSVELESVLLLFRKEAAAVIAYREKNGLFKSVDDLKKVPGVDAKKIDAQKDRLYFGGIVPTPPKHQP
jgi:competence protein ComEA